MNDERDWSYLAPWVRRWPRFAIVVALPIVVAGMVGIAIVEGIKEWYLQACEVREYIRDRKRRALTEGGRG